MMRNPRVVFSFILLLPFLLAAPGCGGGDVGGGQDQGDSLQPLDAPGGVDAMTDGATATDVLSGPCDDGLECTNDSLVSAEACDHVLRPGFCLVDGVCYADGDEDPENQCYSCQTALAVDGFLPDDTLACDDGDGCTGGDHCEDGTCVAGSLGCDDGNPCTSDGCVAGQCENSPVDGDCDDGDLCTVQDACSGGVCKGTPVDCDDGNPCTSDTCDKDGGCLNEPLMSTEPVPCEDGNLCTDGDICIDGECSPGAGPPDCDDGNPCTDDGCVPSKGCVPLPNSAACDDGDPCTVDDVCKGSVCTPGPGSLSCDDGNVCTNDACVPGKGCVNAPNADSCDDGEPCHLDDFCQDGACQPGPNLLACDDGNECTDDSCVDGTGCQNLFNTSECEDGSVCTMGDTCDAGSCKGTPVSCDDGNECTVDSCDPLAGCQHEPDMLKPECRPQIVVDYPPRAATLDGDRDLTITGKVTSKAGFVTELSLAFNGAAHPLLPSPVDGSFALPVTSDQGINTIVIDAKDQIGRSDHAVQSYYYSTTWYPVDATNPAQSQVEDGMMVFLGPDVWDDNDTSDADDIATIMTLFVKNLDLSGMISNPVATGKEYGCDYKVNLGTITFNKTDMPVDLVPVDGGLKIKVTIKDVYVPFDANFSGNLGLCNAFDTGGNVKVAWITIESTLLISVNAAGEPVVTSSGSKVTMSEPDVSVGNFLVDLLKDFFLGDLKSMLQDAFEGQLGSTLEETVADALKSLALDQTFEIPPLIGDGTPTELAIKTRFSSVEFTSAGGSLGFWATVVTPKGTLHNPLGSIGRAACLTGDAEPFAFPKKRQLELGLHDDFFNQITYGMYWGGLLAMPLSAQDLGQDLTGYGIEDMSLDVDFLLPPIITSCNPDEQLLMEIGDISIVADFKLFGSPVKMQVYATMIAQAEIVATEGEIGIALQDPQFLDLEIASVEGGLAGAEDTMGTLMKDTFMPQLLDTFTGGALGSFPVPEIDLSGFDPSIPPGSVIAINLEEVLRVFGYTVLSGNVK